VYGCSADPAASHQAFIQKCGLGVGLLTDADRAVMTAYGAWGTKVVNGQDVVGTIRSTVVIAPDGRVAHHWPMVKAQGHAEEVRARLAELQGAPSAASARSAAPAAAAAPAAPAPKARPRKKKPAPKRAKPAARKPARKPARAAPRPAAKRGKKAAKKPAKQSKPKRGTPRR
jgi:hypothetical protein